MNFNFDRIVERRSSNSMKWRRYGPDVLPMWLADMDFEAPPAVIEAIRKQAEHGVYGYPVFEPAWLKEIVAERMLRLHGWLVNPDEVILVPGVVTGFNWVSHAIGQPGDEILVQTPAYPPILSAPENSNRGRIDLELTRSADGSYTIDFDQFEQSISPQTRLFLLCNPQNPSGRVFSRAELERMAEICLRHNIVICSDEIHGELVYSGHRHIPIASLSPEIAAQTVTLTAPSKTFNVAGLECSFAIVQNKELRKRLEAARQGLVCWVNVFGTTAAEAAYREGQPWLEELLVYLEGNRDYLYQAVPKTLPGVRMGKPEGTYLAWLDCRELGLAGSPYRFFLEKARVGLNDGAAFGKGGQGFVRLNFGCPRSTLVEGLERMAAAVQAEILD